MSEPVEIKIKDVIEKTIVFFKQKNFDSPRLDAELLIASTLGLQRIDLYLKYDQPLSQPELERCRAVVKRRSSGEPVAYILGKKDFYGFSFFVSPEVLIPRPETEHIVEEALAWTQGRENLRILDLGCGSGCISLSLVKSIPGSKATMVDLSSGALEVSKKNSTALEMSERCQFIRADASEKIFGLDMFDIIVANPPYIEVGDPQLQKSVQDFEPNLALFSDKGGLGAFERWSAAHAASLAKPGIMIFEHGATQGQAALQIFKNLNIFDEVRIVKDLSGHDRQILGIR